MKPVLAIHGGAGFSAKTRARPYREALMRALQAGWGILGRGESALDAVTAAVVALEDDPLFNAGRGAVALDGDGNLAAATSTGGFTGKLPGRVGDSPIIGAGTWADNEICAVSGTGHGELFMRTALAHDVAARIKYGKQSLQSAARDALAAVARLGGDGGLVALDRRGNIAMPFNSEAMLRACIGRDGRAVVKIGR